MPVEMRDPLNSGSNTPTPEAEEGTSLSDYGNAALGTVGDIGASLAGTSRWLSEKSGDEDQAEIDRIGQKQARAFADERRDAMSPAAKAAANASVLDASTYEHPFRVLAMKGAAMAPFVVAAALPGGIVGEAFGATMGAAATFGANAALGAGSFIESVDKKLDEASDKTLVEQSDYYAGLRARMGEKDARAEFKDYMLNGNGRLALNALVSGLTAIAGPAGMAGRAATGGNAVIGAAEQSALGRAGMGALEGAGAMGLQGGVSNATEQQAGIKGGFQQGFDWHQWTSQTLEGMGLGGLMSGAIGGLTKPGNTAKTPKDMEAVTERGPDAAQALALGKKPDGALNGEIWEMGANASQDPQASANTMHTAPLRGPEAFAYDQPGNLNPANDRVSPGSRGADDYNKGPGMSPGDTSNDNTQFRTGAANDTEPMTPRQGANENAPYRTDVPNDNAQFQTASTNDNAPSRAREAANDLGDIAKKVNETPTVPESQDTIDVQRQALKDGERAAVMYPASMKDVPPQMEGFKRLKTKKGVFDYDPAQLKPKDIQAAVKSGRENEILDLGSKNKADVAASAAKGNPEVAIVERTPKGTEAKAAAGTTETAPQQMAEMKPSVSPGNKLELTTPQQVIADRKAAAPKAPKGEKIKEVAKSRAKAAAEALPQKAAPKAEPKPVVKAAAEALPQKPEVTAPSKPKVEPTGRILRSGEETSEGYKPLSKLDEADLTKAEKKKLEASQELDPDQVGEKAVKEPEAKNWDKDERARRGYNNQVSGEIAKDHPPTKAEDGFMEKGAAGKPARDAILERAKAMVEDANKRLLADKKGNRILQRVKDGADAEMNHHEHMILIREAEMLVNRAKPSIQDFTDFVNQERLARGGDREGVIAYRKEKGDELFKRQQKGAEDVAAKVEPTIESSEGGGELSSKGAPDMEKTEVTRSMSGSDEAVAAKPDALSYGKDDVTTSASSSAKGPVRLADASEERTVTNKKGEQVTVAGTKAEPGRKIELTPELKAMYESLANSPRKLRAMAEGRDAGAYHPTADEISHQTTLGEAMRTLDLSKLHDPDRGINRGIVMKVLNRLREKVADTEIVVVDQATMDRLNPGHKGADGYYDPQQNYIAVSDRLYKNGKFDASLVAHEGVHALLQKGLESDPTLKALTQKLLDKVKDELPGEKHYGFTDVHEFIAEAMSNVEFQNVLMGIKLSAEDAHALGMGRRSATVWDSLVNAVHQFVMKARDALGIGSPEYNMLSAVMRVAEHAEKHGDVIRKVEAGNAELLRHMSMGTKAKELLDKVKEKTSSAKEAGETFREHALDFNRPLEREQQNIESKTGAKLPENERFYEGKRLMESRIMERERQFEQTHGKEASEVLKQAKDTGLDVDKALTAYHATERNAEILKRDPQNASGSGMTDADAKAQLAAIKADPKKQAAFDRLVKLNETLRDVELKTKVESGRLTQDQANTLRGMFKTYTSLKGFSDADIAKAVGDKNIGLIGRSDMSVVGSGVRAAEGRVTESDSPLHNMMQQARLAIVQAERNKVVKSAADAARRAGYVKDGDHPFYIASSINDKNIGSYKTALSDPRILGFMEDGKQKFVVFKDKELAESFQRIRPDELPAFFKQVSGITNGIKALWTHYSPAFVIRHFVFRYPIEGVMNLQGLKERGVDTNAAGYLKDAFGNVRDIYHYLNGEQVKDPRVAKYVKEMAEAGGIVSFKNMSDTFDLKKQIADLSKVKTNGILDKMHNFHEAWSTMLTAMDTSERAAVYMRAREAGMSPHEAALAARDATVDFAKKGRSAGWINIWVPFGNVALQTTGRLATALRDSPTYRKTLVGITAGVTAIEMANYTMGGNDKDGTPWIDKIPAYERSQNLVMVTPFKDENGKPYIFKVPLPYPLFAFNTSGTGAAQFVAGKMGMSKISQGEIASRVLHGVAETFTPLGHQIDNLSTLATPEVARFVSELEVNKDWKGDPIHTSYAKKGVDKADQGFKGTDDSWKTIAGVLAKIGIDMYPEDVRYTVDHFFGAERRFGRDVGEAVTDPGKALTKNPVSKILLGAPSDQSDKTRLRVLMDHASFPKETLEALKVKARGGDLSGAQRGLAQAAERRSGMTAAQILEINKVATGVRSAEQKGGETPALMQRGLTKLNQMGVVGGFDK